VACSAIIIVNTLPNFFHQGITGILHILNDVLLALIVMELLWPIVRFLLILVSSPVLDGF
jgi:hypothetical protein